MIVPVKNGKLIVHGIEIEVPEERAHHGPESAEENENVDEGATLFAQEEVESDKSSDMNEIAPKRNVLRSLFNEENDEWIYEDIEEKKSEQEEIELNKSKDINILISEEENVLMPFYSEITDEIFNNDDMDYALSVDESRIIEPSQMSVIDNLTDSKSDCSSYEEEGDSKQFINHLREMKKER